MLFSLLWMMKSQTEEIPGERGNEFQIGKTSNKHFITTSINPMNKESQRSRVIRRYLEETLERELLRASRSDKNVGLMMIDVDHFKQFNDTHGHPAADVLLSAVAHALSSSVRGEDLVCRYGGEEFVIMLPEADLETTCQRAEVIREKVARLNVQYQGQVLQQMSISVGVGVFPSHGDLPEALISSVDQALYRAKHSGRNRVEVSTPIKKNMTL